jgi:glycosyltransferase involved in cell wall biosynthesis
MRIVFLTQYYVPETGAPQNRLADLARHVASMGHEVTVLTALPNYPVGRIQDGYRGKLWAAETIDGVRVRRGWIYATSSRKVLPRLLNFCSFAVAAFFLGLFRLPADVVFVETPPLFSGATAIVLARIKRAKLVVNVADLWISAAESLQVVTNRRLLSLARWFERCLYRAADVITAQTRGIAADVSSRAPGATVRLLTNGASLDRFSPERGDPAIRRELGLDGAFVVGYAGIHGLAQALDKVVEAGRLLATYPEIVLAFFGDGPIKADLQRQAAREGLANIRFFPVQPVHRMPLLLPTWDLALVPLLDGPLGATALPSKMFEIMGAGVPLVLSAPEGEASAIVREASAGLCVPAEDPRALADAILQLRADTGLRSRMGASGRAHVMAHFDRAQIARNFVSYLGD